MTPDLTTVTGLIENALDRVFPAAQIEVRQAGQAVFSGLYGWLDPETRRYPTQLDTLFDLASVTKLFVVTAFMALVEEGVVSLDQPVSTVLPDFAGERPIQPYEDPLKPGAFVTVKADQPTGATTADAGRVTFRHLLTHNSGLPAWRPLYKEGSPEAARRLALSTHFSYPTGGRTIYSDIGLILLGLSVEQLTGLPLDEVVKRRVTEPLALSRTCFLPVERTAVGSRQSVVGSRQSVVGSRQSAVGSRQSAVGSRQSEINVAPTEFCAWRGRRIVGEVHDENAYSLGGIAGHAGLFSNAADLAAFGQSFLAARQPPIFNLQSLLRSATISEMIRLQAQDGAVRRGLGFALWSADPEASGNPFSPAAFGHTGFTGTSLWMDPERSLVVAVCTNRVYYGRDAGGILEFRVALHRALVEVVSSP